MFLKTLKICIVLIASIVCIFEPVVAQDTDDVFIHNYALYKPNSNWVNIGIGGGYNPFVKVSELAGSIEFHASVKKLNLSAGYHLFTDESFISRSYHTMSNFSLGAGYRHETMKRNLAFFVGPLYAFGKKKIQENKYYTFKGPGFFLAAQYTWKFFYDVGIGTTLFYNFSSYYQVVGIKLHLYFSGAFKTGIQQPKIN